MRDKLKGNIYAKAKVAIDKPMSTTMARKKAGKK